MRARSRRARSDRSRAERRDAGHGDRGRQILDEIVGRVEDIRTIGGGRLRGAHRAGAARPSEMIPASSSTCCSATPRCRRTWSCTMSTFRRRSSRAFGGPRSRAGRPARARRRGRSRADLLGAQAAGPAAGPARGTGGAVRARRHRLHQGRPRPRRPGLFAVRGARRGDRGGAAHGRARDRPAHALRAEPVRRSRCAARARSRRRRTPASTP